LHIDAWLVIRGLFFIHGSFKAPDLFVSVLVAGAVISFYGYLKLAYTRGAVTLGRSWIHTISPWEPFRELERFLVNPQETNW
jgi:hypothetical protein